mmetsp:Transcript_71470/g.149395  ORF Transcript_71470/g.149395 Transcript_71470/m.149395 type:complete len:299 (-) Transcript_71470:1915-2811(-)
MLCRAEGCYCLHKVSFEAGMHILKSFADALSNVIVEKGETTRHFLHLRVDHAFIIFSRCLGILELQVRETPGHRHHGVHARDAAAQQPHRRGELDASEVPGPSGLQLEGLDQLEEAPDPRHRPSVLVHDHDCSTTALRPQGEIEGAVLQCPRHLVLQVPLVVAEGADPVPRLLPIRLAAELGVRLDAVYELREDAAPKVADEEVDAPRTYEVRIGKLLPLCDRLDEVGDAVVRVAVLEEGPELLEELAKLPGLNGPLCWARRSELCPGLCFAHFILKSCDAPHPASGGVAHPPDADGE